MSKISTSIFVSLDGFCAKPDGDISWFKPNQQFFDYAGQLTDNADTAIYGRITYEMMDAYWPTAGDEPDASPHDIQHSSWYNQARKIVFSETVENQSADNTIFLGQNSVEKLREIKNNSTEDMVIFGSPSIVSLLTDADLIDEYYIFISPTILGNGLPLFKNIHSIKNLTLIESKQLDTGATLLHYKIKG